MTALLVGIETEIVSWSCLEQEAAFLAVDLPLHDDQRGAEADHVEIVAQLLRIPDLTVLGLKCLSRLPGTALISAGTFPYEWTRLDRSCILLV